MPSRQTCYLLVLAHWLTLQTPVCAQLFASPTLQESARTNGASTLAALKPLRQTVISSGVEVLGDEAHLLARGVLVSADGYFLTKASEVAQIAKIRVLLPNQTTAEARRVTVDRRLDLLLAHVPLVDATAAPWVPGSKLERGQWLTGVTSKIKNQSSCPDLCLGVLSATSRTIPTRGAGLGIRMDVDPKHKAVRIDDLAADGPATVAGLQRGDLLLGLDGQEVTSILRVKQIMAHLSAGEEVPVRFRRDSKEVECKVRLASLAQVVSNFDGEDYGNGGISIRTDGFPSVIQHATPLSPSDMGGALFDLQGNAVGINIARADRVTTFALPTEAFWTEAQEWIRADRSKIGKN